MTPTQEAELRRLRGRVKLLESRNRALSGAFSKIALDRFAWLVNEIEALCPKPYQRGRLLVTRADAKLLRPILEGLVNTR